MKLLRRLLLLALLPLLSAAQPVRFGELALPAATGSTAPDLASAADGSLYLSWVEPRPEAAGHALRLTRFDRDADAWTEPATVAQGTNWVVNPADSPTLTAGLRGQLAAVWHERDTSAPGTSRAMFATSSDHGLAWSPAAPLTTESTATSFAVLAPLLNGKWLALWLDGRAGGADGATQLRSRLLGSDEPDTLVDDRVAHGSNLAVSVLPNGAVLVAYRDRSADEHRDLTFQRYSRGAWSAATAPEADDWRVADGPVDGPRLARRGAHVAAAWFTAATGEPTVMTARSNNIGTSWNLVGPVSDATRPPVGRADVAVTRDGSQWISWVERDGALALRRLDRDGALHPIDRLPLPSAPNSAAPPRLVLLDNHSDEPARLLIARPEPDRVRTWIATLPLEEGATLDDCGCGPQEDSDRGHPLRGRIKQVLAEQNALVVAHEAVSSVLPAAATTFAVDPRVIPLVAPGQEILARLERRSDGRWWLFNLRLLKPAGAE